MHVHVTTTVEQGGTVVLVSGEVDLHTAGDLGAALTEVAESEARRLIVDLSGVDFMDSTGLSVIIQAVADMEAKGGSVAVVTTTPKITKVFTLTGLDQRIPMFTSTGEALHP